MIAILTGLTLFGLIAWMRNGNGGVIGRAVRNSDYWAWRDAVYEKEQELAELRKLEPKQP